MAARHAAASQQPEEERFTRAEYLKARREYSDNYYLGKNEVYPKSPEEEAAAWRKVELKGPITFYGGAPHRPKG